MGVLMPPLADLGMPGDFMESPDRVEAASFMRLLGLELFLLKNPIVEKGGVEGRVGCGSC